ncbi:MAG TPA: cyanophycin synthetase, partial [Thermoanaerobaculia bacterium]|nr:cyanophycin synthetase [Thermoanaerobaculia bacterium]
LVLDDAYNSNPRSVRAALEAARETAARRGAGLVVALGDMLELGELAPAEHDAMVAAADAAGARRLVLVGPQSAAAAARSALATPTALFESSEAAAAAIGDLVLPGDVVLVKGSRGIRTERLIAALARRAGVEVGLAL